MHAVDDKPTEKKREVNREIPENGDSIKETST
jgi:hypothetical protein